MLRDMYLLGAGISVSKEHRVKSPAYRALQSRSDQSTRAKQRSAQIASCSSTAAVVATTAAAGN